MLHILEHLKHLIHGLHELHELIKHPEFLKYIIFGTVIISLFQLVRFFFKLPVRQKEIIKEDEKFSPAENKRYMIATFVLLALLIIFLIVIHL